MYDTETLTNLCESYLIYCGSSNSKPSHKGLASWIEVSTQTINNVVRGYYCIGKPYTPKPHITRKIDNDDFELIRSVFS